MPRISRRRRAEMAHHAHCVYQRGQLAGWDVDCTVAAIIHELPEITLLEARRFAHGWSRPQVIHGITALYVADGLAVPPLNSSMLCRWEHGDRPPNAEYRDLLCRLYRVELGQLGLATYVLNGSPAADRYPHARHRMVTPVRLIPQLPPEYLDSSTPSDVIVTDRVRPPIEDPTLGEPLGALSPDAPSLAASPAHRLVTVGDSLTHGMVSGAVFRTDLSWPSLVANGLNIQGFTVPGYGGPLGGLPLNLEGLLRQLQKKFGDDLNILEELELPFTLQHLVDENEDYWERGDGRKPPRTDLRYENLGIYGWDVRDALSYTAGRAAQRAAATPQDSFFGAKPDNDNDIAASSVLAPFGIDATQIEAAAWHGRNGGIDTLVVALGANNALGSIVNKRLSWSGPGFDDLARKSEYNVWRPVHFAVEYGEVVKSLRAISARRVMLATVPHVTIAPIAKGVNPQNPGQKWREGSRFFPYYIDPWIDEGDFRPSKHRYLTHQQARAIDSAIDQFNDIITDAVRHARREGRDWLVLDLCGVLDGLGYRRYVIDPAAAARNGWARNALPQAIADLDTRFFLADKTGRHQGGLFGLDGVHPTTSGYGIIAQAVLDVLSGAGVDTNPIDFATLRGKDTLNAQPPVHVATMLALLAPFLTRFVSHH